MTFDGKVEEIVYVNEETGYTVLYFSADDNYFTAVGIFPLIAEGELLKITGEFKTNSRFGEQFVVDRVEFSKPDNVQGIFKFLSSGLFRGIGEKTATDIINKFGLATLEILDTHPERLAEVRGIGAKKCIDIVVSYNKMRKMKESILFLQKYDITMGLALKIYKKYENNTINIVSANPYCLVEDIEGVGFITADRIANKMGIDKHSPFRVRAGLLHVLKESAISGGHTCLPYDVLIAEGVKLLGVEEAECIEALQDMPSIKVLSVDDIKMVVDRKNYETENAIAGKLIRLNEGVAPMDFDVDEEIEIFQRTNKITLDAKQKEAIAGVFKGGVTVITGGPGTGKTTIIKGVTTIMRQRRKRVMLSAPTGRACKRIFEATGEDAKTLHRLLGIDFTEQRCYDETNPLLVDVLIVDEISMADIYIFNALLRAIPVGARLILVGDKDQLPSVSCGNILSDTIGSGMIRTIFLTEVYRQAEGSFIVTNAHRINKGEMPVTKNTGDFFFINKTDSSDILNDVVGMTKSRIPFYLSLSSSDVQVLAPMKKTFVGVENINKVLQEALNAGAQEKTYGEISFRIGDRVMQTMNDYQLEWKKDNGEIGCGVYNGDLGRVLSFDKNTLTVYFEDGKRVTYEGSQVEEIMLAYCISVHKSQGSEFPVVILVLPNGGAPTLMTRNLLYTAVTRAKKMVVIIGGEDALKRMISNTYTAKRYSLLKPLLKKSSDNFNLLWGKR